MWSEWTDPANEHIRTQFPEVTNGATYALYAFFNYNEEKLRVWHETYRKMFGDAKAQPFERAFLQSSETTIEPFLAKPFHDPNDSFYTVNSFFDHDYPRYDGEGDGHLDKLYRFDGMVLENAAFDPCELQLNCYSGHDAYDYNTGRGPKIRAAASGKVIDVLNSTGSVIIEHENGLYTVYMHLEAAYVKKDDVVEQGDEIGESGNKGLGHPNSDPTTGAHLHFGVRYPDSVEKDIDPFGWWGSETDPWSIYQTLGKESTWLWKGDEAGDSYLTVDNRESQAQLFREPATTPPSPPDIGWHRLTSGYKNEAWYTFMHKLTDTSAYWAMWGSTIEQPGEYVVQAYWPSDPDPNDEWESTSNARYKLYFQENGAMREVFLYANQTLNAGRFNPLCKIEHPEGNCPEEHIARFTFESGATSLILSNPAGYDVSQHQKILFFDAVRWQQDIPPTPTPPPSTQTVRVSINKGSDDAGTNPTPCVSNATDNEVYLGACFNGSDITSGFRFENIEIPRGANIESAYVHFTADGTYTVPVQVRIYGEASGNPLTYSASNPPAIRSTTSESNSVLWDITDTWSLGEPRTTPDISSVIREIVSRGYWNSGQPISIIVKNAGSSNVRRVIAYERASFDPQLEPAELEITYSFNGTPPPTSTPVTPTPTPVPTNTPTPIPPTPNPLPECSTCALIRLLQILGGGCVEPTVSASRFAIQSNDAESISGQTPEFDINVFYSVRDGLLNQTPQGQHYIDLYNMYTPEIAETIAAHPQLIDEAIDVLQRWEPHLRSLIDGNGDSVVITEEDIQSVQSFLDQLKSFSSPELQAVIGNEQLSRPPEQMIGMTMDDAWAHLNGYQFEWLKPVSNSDPYETKAGPVIPIQFGFTNTQGNFVSDESVRIEIVDSNGNVVIGPVTVGSNPANGIVIQNQKYHYNLETKGLKEGSYTLKVYYNSVNPNEPFTWAIKIKGKK